jgi:hypothetical protein
VTAVAPTAVDVATVAAVATVTAVTTDGLCAAGGTGVHAAIERVAVTGISATDHDDRTLAAASMAVGRGR